MRKHSGLRRSTCRPAPREFADRLKTTLKMIDYYERRANNPSVEFVSQAARILSVSVAELLGEEVQIKRARKSGPTGKVHKIFKEVSKLPRRQQEKIVEVSPPSSTSTRKLGNEPMLLVTIWIRCWRRHGGW